VREAARQQDGVVTVVAGALLMVLRAVTWIARLPLALRALVREPVTAVVRVDGRVLRDSDGQPVAPPDALARVLRRAADVFAEQARVHLVLGDVEVVDGAAPPAALRPPCNAPALVHALSPAGRYLRRQAVPGGVTVVAVDVVAPGRRTAGCSLGPLADHVVVGRSGLPGRDGLTAAHELGHALGLSHLGATGTLMQPGPAGRRPSLHRWQVALLRASRHLRPA
jgi:hypothetical protein